MKKYLLSVMLCVSLLYANDNKTDNKIVLELNSPTKDFSYINLADVKVEYENKIQSLQKVNSFFDQEINSSKNGNNTLKIKISTNSILNKEFAKMMETQKKEEKELTLFGITKGVAAGAFFIAGNAPFIAVAAVWYGVDKMMYERDRGVIDIDYNGKKSRVYLYYEIYKDIDKDELQKYIAKQLVNLIKGKQNEV